MRGLQPRGQVRLARSQRARAWDAAAVATGHYARITRDRGSRPLPALARARRPQGPVGFPLAAHAGAARAPRAFRWASSPRTRCATRRARLGLVTADKPESQEICFIPDDDYRGFLRRRDPGGFRPGPDRGRAGHACWAAHEGLANYTVGQRRGLGLWPRRGRSTSPRSIPARNAVVVGGRRRGRGGSALGRAGELHRVAAPRRPARGDGQDPPHATSRRRRPSGRCEARRASRCDSTRPSGRRRRASRWSSTRATSSWAAASSRPEPGSRLTVFPSA